MEGDSLDAISESTGGRVRIGLIDVDAWNNGGKPKFPNERR